MVQSGDYFLIAATWTSAYNTETMGHRLNMRAIATFLKEIVTSLSFQVILLIGIGLAAVASIQYFYAEQVLEETMLEEVKKQAYTYLLGIERQVQSRDNPLDPAGLSRIFREAISHDISTLSFSIINIYLYDTKGSVIAYVKEPDETPKDMSGYYGEVVSSGRPYMGSDIESHHIEETGKIVPSTDIIIPLHYKEGIIGGIEVEINLEKTFSMIRQADNRYEDRIFFMIVGAIMLSLLIIWLIMHWRLVSPVKKLGTITRRIAEGDLGARTLSASNDEIGHLSVSVDKMASSIDNLFQELDHAYIGILNSLSTALEARDEYTAHHSQNVTGYSLLLGQRIGLDHEQLKKLAQGAMLHDLGKIGIPDSVLKKPGNLTEEEIRIIQGHAQVTSQILAPLEKFKHFSEIARSHHERWDGKGYPDGLRAEEIPILARIVSIADTWDAMTTNRGYRKGMSIGTALSILEQEKGRGQWDPLLVEEFICLIRGKHGLDTPAPADPGQNNPPG